MGSRRRARQFALQALYQADLMERSGMASLNHLWDGLVDGAGMNDEPPPDSEEMEFAVLLVTGTLENQPSLDALIEQCSTNWRLARMPLVDRNVLRMAAFELSERKDVPASVAINEAIELAKRFGTADSGGFVNGIADRMARTLKRTKTSSRGKAR